MQNATTVRQAIMKVRVSGNCTDTTLEFQNADYKTYDNNYINTANIKAPLNKSCHIFEAAGGGVRPPIASIQVHDLNNPAAKGTTQWKLGTAAFRVAQIRGAGTDGVAGTVSANDLAFVMNYINRDVCMAINDMVGVTNLAGNPPPITNLGGGTTGKYTNGSFTTSVIYNLNSNPIFCGGTSANYQFWFSIIER